MSTTACMYLGPSRPFGLPLMRNAILRGKPEEVFPVLADLFEEHPELRTLFVPVDGDLATARMLLTMRGTVMYQAYVAVQDESVKPGRSRRI